MHMNSLTVLSVLCKCWFWVLFVAYWMSSDAFPLIRRKFSFGKVLDNFLHINITVKEKKCSSIFIGKKNISWELLKSNYTFVYIKLGSLISICHDDVAELLK